MDFDLDSVKRFLEFLYTGDYHEIPDPALALITTVPSHDEGIQDATVQQSIEQAIGIYSLYLEHMSFSPTNSFSSFR